MSPSGTPVSSGVPPPPPVSSSVPPSGSTAPPSGDSPPPVPLPSSSDPPASKGSSSSSPPPPPPAPGRSPGRPPRTSRPLASSTPLDVSPQACSTKPAASRLHKARSFQRDGRVGDETKGLRNMAFTRASTQATWHQTCQSNRSCGRFTIHAHSTACTPSADAPAPASRAAQTPPRPRPAWPDWCTTSTRTCAPRAVTPRTPR